MGQGNPAEARRSCALVVLLLALPAACDGEPTDASPSAPPAGARSSGDHRKLIAFASDPDGFFWAGASPEAAGSGNVPSGDVYTMSPDGSRRRRLTYAPGNDFSPRWSPDGSSIVFRSTRDGNDEIYVMDADGRAETNLTRTQFEERSPSWSPDGSRIVFASIREEGLELYVMDADGSNQRLLTDIDDGMAEYPDWSPDGDLIVFHGTQDVNPYFDVFVVDAGGSNVRNLTRTPDESETYPRWSPDGTRIVFEADGDVATMSADGSRRERLTRGDHLDTEPTWSPDGRRMVFVRQPRRRGDRLFARIFVATRDGGRPRPISPRGWGDIQPSWRPRCAGAPSPIPARPGGARERCGPAPRESPR